jgi:hypothetical protein
VFAALSVIADKASIDNFAGSRVTVNCPPRRPIVFFISSSREFLTLATLVYPVMN